MGLVVVTEGQAEAHLVKELARREGAEARVVYLPGRSMAVSHACKLLVSTDDAVLLLVDADVPPADAARSRYQTEHLLATVAPAARWRVEQFVPEFEALFFEARQVLTKHYGEVSLVQQAKAEYDPKRVLEELAAGAPDRPQSVADLVARLDPEDIAALRGTTSADRIVEAFQQLSDANSRRPAA